MAATRVSIAKCNEDRISVFFDADVIIKAIRDRASGEWFERLNRVDPQLRLVASTTLFEVVFARGGTANSTLKANHDWVRNHFGLPVPFNEGVGQELERFLQLKTRRIRGKTGLGDLLLACWTHALPAGAGGFAIATRNSFEGLPVVLVEDFLVREGSTD